MAQISDTQVLLPILELEIIDSLVSESEAMRRCLQLADGVVSADVPVMLAGEGGAGKSLLARYIHARSPKRSRPCLNFRCADLGPVELRNRLQGGLLAEAAGGTVVFDGVDRMSGAGQRELLYLLSSPEWREMANVRLFSTVGTGTEPGAIFTEGLEHLLSESIVRVPPLRERREDVERLSQRALQAANKAQGKRVLGFSRGASEFLLHYDFPGNVRELFFIVSQAVRQARRDVLFAEDFRISTDDGAEESGGNGGQLLSLAEVERRYIGKVLVRTGWKKSAAARVLQISETMLNRKMKLYDLEREQ